MRTSDLLSIRLHPFLRALVKLERNYELDIFTYTQAGYTASPDFVVGLVPTDELKVQEDTSREALKQFAFQDQRPTLGFLSYDYGLHLNNVQSKKEKAFPWGHLKKYEAYFIYRNNEQTVEIQAKHRSFFYELQNAANETSIVLNHEFKPSRPVVHSSFSQAAYMDAVKRVVEYIQAGDSYQLNLSIAFNAKVVVSSIFGLFAYLMANYPAAHYGLLNTGCYSILSTSPETFLKVKDGSIMSSPIKGTRSIEQGSLVEQMESLVRTQKEAAELSMIVDLIRNDISKHCEYQSVRVEDHQHVFQVDDLLQMCTHVCGSLRTQSTVLDLLLDAFPGGSITGFPKERSMQIIESIEPHTRSVYCGTLFALWNEKNIDASIAIRTAYYDHEASQFCWFAGSGITRLSDPLAEYEEALAKSSKFWRLFRPKR